MHYMLPPFKMFANNDLTRWRQETFWTKEPETIQWIKSFQNYINIHKISQKVFVDVGANIGIYSLYAAWLYPEMKIIAIEPDINNYFELVCNIKLNHFKNIIPLNLAIGAYNDTSFFNPVDNDQPGNSGGKLIETGFGKDSVSLLSITIDYLSKISHIDFLKMDIDGSEYEAIFGMHENLGKILTMLIEFDKKDKRYETVMKYIEDSGYVCSLELNGLKNHSRFRRKIEGHENIENIVFDLVQ